jgi:hypothetical protein
LFSVKFRVRLKVLVIFFVPYKDNIVCLLSSFFHSKNIVFSLSFHHLLICFCLLCKSVFLQVYVLPCVTSCVCCQIHFGKFLFPFYTQCVATLALGSRPKQKGLQGCGPKGSLRVTSETPESARECEGVSLHTPKATPTLGERVQVDSQNFKEPFEGSKLNGLWRSLYHWKALGT